MDRSDVVFSIAVLQRRASLIEQHNRKDEVQHYKPVHKTDETMSLADALIMNRSRLTVESQQQSTSPSFYNPAQPLLDDILLGRGNEDYPGNCKLNEIIKGNVDAYNQATARCEKAKLVHTIYKQICTKHSGRFLKYSTERNCWELASPSQARDKISQALRYCCRKTKSQAKKVEKQQQQLQTCYSNNASPQVAHLPNTTTCTSQDNNDTYIATMQSEQGSSEVLLGLEDTTELVSDHNVSDTMLEFNQSFAAHNLPKNNTATLQHQQQQHASSYEGHHYPIILPKQYNNLDSQRQFDEDTFKYFASSSSNSAQALEAATRAVMARQYVTSQHHFGHTTLDSAAIYDRNSSPHHNISTNYPRLPQASNNHTDSNNQLLSGNINNNIDDDGGYNNCIQNYCTPDERSALLDNSDYVEILLKNGQEYLQDAHDLYNSTQSRK